MLEFNMTGPAVCLGTSRMLRGLFSMCISHFLIELSCHRSAGWKIIMIWWTDMSCLGLFLSESQVKRCPLTLYYLPNCVHFWIQAIEYSKGLLSLWEFLEIRRNISGCSPERSKGPPLTYDTAKRYVSSSSGTFPALRPCGILVTSILHDFRSVALTREGPVAGKLLMTPSQRNV